LSSLLLILLLLLLLLLAGSTDLRNRIRQGERAGVEGSQKN
jgi:hypothetical protein